MFSTTKLFVSVLAVLGSSAPVFAAPAPILGTGAGALGSILAGANGGAKVGADGKIKVDADLKVFTDAFLKVTTGGRAATVDTVNLGLGAITSVTAVAKAQVFGAIAQGHCVATYSDVAACSELTAYLSATYYAYVQGWTGVDLFAALGNVRCGRWHSLITGLCAAKACPTGLCSGIIGQFDALVKTSVDVKLDVSAVIRTSLQSCGLLGLIDVLAILKVDANGIIRIGARNLPRALPALPLVSITDVVASATGKGEGAGLLGLNEDGLDLGLAGKGKGKGFLGLGVLA